MNSDDRYIGERLSLKGQSCTVRYIGPVGDKAGSWLGVEWDDATRGKHAGNHAGVDYFKCRSKSSTAASFLRPNQPWDQSRTFLQALTDKYMSSESHNTSNEVIYISGKQAEEVGFRKFSERQTKLQGIHVLVLDHMNIKHPAGVRADERAVITASCANITDLDLSSNLFETLDEVLQVCRLLPSLRVLTLDGNRIALGDDCEPFALSDIQQLSIARMTLQQEDVHRILKCFPNLRSVSLADNDFTSLTLNLQPHLSTLDLASNKFERLCDIRGLDSSCPKLQDLVLKSNSISAVGPDPSALGTIQYLDLSSNAIHTWDFFNDLSKAVAPRLQNLRIAKNPLYQHLQTASGKPLAAEDGYMLTIARLPQLDTLNYSKITDRERLNAETYYLSQIALELSQAPESTEQQILRHHPRYHDLCAEYGEPRIQRKREADELDPASLAAQLIRITFHLEAAVLPAVKDRSWVDEIPKSLDVYSVLGLVAKRLGVVPFKLGLVLETTEQDPAARDTGYAGPEWWDSSDEEENGGQGEDEWISREIELVPGTGALATYVDGREATVRVKISS